MGQTVRESPTYTATLNQKLDLSTINGLAPSLGAHQPGATTAWCGGGVVAAVQLVRRRGGIATGDIHIQYCQLPRWRIGSDPRKEYDRLTYLGKYSFVDTSSMMGIVPFLPA